MDVFIILVVVMVSRVDVYVQTHQIVHVKCAGFFFFLYHLYLNEAVKNRWYLYSFLSQACTALIIKNYFS